MRTRTLLLLAVAVGLLILIAGTIQLLRVDTGSSAEDDLAIGESAAAGDLEVTVISAEEQDGAMTVEVRVGGVDDPEGFDGFALLGGAIVPADEPAGANACRAVTEAVQTCVLTFDTSDLPDGPRVLRVRRGEDQRRWVVG